MRCLVVWARRWEGLGQLRRSRQLDHSAAIRAAEIARCGQFSHTPCSHAFASSFARGGYLTPGASVGENLGFGNDELGSPRAVMADWLASPPHRTNLLRTRWRDFGIAVLHADLFGATNVTLWVLDFGRRS